MAEDAYEIAYEIYNDWGTGFNGAITIKNISEEVIEDWKLAFDFENEFTDIWNAKIVSREGEHYELLNAGYNSNIGVGESVSIGFVVGNGNARKVMTSSVLSAFSLDGFIEDGQADIQGEQDKSYVKDAAEEDIIFDKEGGVHYVKNQIIVSTHLGASKELMGNLAEELGADIVGYIELTEDYQLEFREEMTYTELMEKIAYVRGFPFVRYAEVNLASPCEAQAFSNDTLYNTGELWVTEWQDLNGDGKREDKEMKTTKQAGKNDGWELHLVGGNNWGLEALNVDEAWDYKDKSQGPVRVGIYDGMFGENKDLKIEVISAEPDIIDSAHGTHVAGIIGAKHNNRGISGVATDVDLYGYAEKGSNATLYHGIERLVKNKVRVINVSYGYNEGFAYAATKAANGNYENDPYKMIIREANALSDKLQRLIERGYDFLIVNSAGNGNGQIYVRDTENTELDESYVLYNSKNSNHTGLTQYIGYPDAKYNFHISAIEEKAVKSRIMVVGSVGHTISGLKTTYWIAGSSMEGERVDTYAPGVEILSTVPEAEFSDGYMTKSGTSMAAPHISGLAALIWQVNPNLTAAQVKKIIKENKGLQIGKTGKYMPDAKKCVVAALKDIE